MLICPVRPALAHPKSGTAQVLFRSAGLLLDKLPFGVASLRKAQVFYPKESSGAQLNLNPAWASTRIPRVGVNDGKTRWVRRAF